MNKNIKILVITHNAFSNISNNGKTFASLFSSYPKENISQLFFSQNEYPDFDFCNNYFKITDLDVLKNLITFSDENGGVLSPNDTPFSTVKGNIKTKRILWSSLKVISKSFRIFRDLLWKSGSWKTKSLFQWIDSFNPDIVFFCGGGAGFSHEVAVFLKEKYDIPLVSYFTDDYIINPKIKNVLDRFQRRRMKRFYSKTIKNSSLLFAIGDLMAEEYTKYFGKIFYPIMNSVSSDKYDHYNKLKKTDSPILKISYFGGLHLNRWKMIGVLGSILNEIKLTSSHLVELRVFTNSKITPKIKNNFEINNIIIEKPIKGDNLINEMVKTDILLHVESDDVYNRSLTKLSISTKIPEYLLSKNCVLAYGPSEVASIKLLSDNNIGFVIDSSENNDFISEELLKLIENEKNRLRIGEDGYDYAKKFFDASITRASFMEKIAEVLTKAE